MSSFLLLKNPPDQKCQYSHQNFKIYSEDFKLFKPRPMDKNYRPRRAIETSRENVKKLFQNYIATICKITMQVSLNSVDSKLFKLRL